MREIINYICLILQLIVLMYLIKNQNTFRNFEKISDAIMKYDEKEIQNGSYENVLPFEESYTMSYEKALLRFWDWGCDRLVSKETYEKIKEFL